MLSHPKNLWEKKKKTVVNNYSLVLLQSKKCFLMQIKIKGKAHIKYLNETIFKISLAFGVEQIVILKSM